MKMKLLRAVHVMIALLLFSVCGAAQQLPTDESAPLSWFALSRSQAWRVALTT
jgi:hypothetical protein